MKHRSPLVTLAAVAVAFAIMFGINMASGPPGNSSTGAAGPSGAPATAKASSLSPQQTAIATPSASPSKSGEKSAGLYPAHGSKTIIGWIVLENGFQVGIQTTGTDSAAAPRLDAENPQVTVDGANLHATPINGDQDL